MSYVVVFRSTGNALLRPGRPNWQTRADMLARVETDGLIADSEADALALARDFMRGSSGLAAVPLDEWRVAK